MKTETLLLKPDLNVPNNPALPLVLYREAFQLPAEGAEQAIIAQFARHGWTDAWVNGIYGYHHYHATAHEVLGIARGFAEVRFGGPSGRLVRVERGDAVLIPAGVGHCRVAASDDLSVVGAYPEGQTADLRRDTPGDVSGAAERVANVPHPPADPVTGAAAWPG